MNILIVSPAAVDALLGNAVTARRWASMLTDLGHQVQVAQEYEPGGWDVLVCLHASKSHGALLAGKQARPEMKVIVAMTGTDLYGDLPHGAQAQESIALADRIVVLHPKGGEVLPVEVQSKVRPILQSVALSPSALPVTSNFPVLVLAHLREVKDPLLAAKAARLLPSDSKVLVTLLGEVIDPAYGEQASLEVQQNPRLQWPGALPHDQAMEKLAQAKALVISSKMEGGAHVISEAAVLGVPILATAIHSSIGLLGEKHPGLFPVGDVQALANLLQRLEADADFAAELRQCSQSLAPLFAPARERQAWAALLAEWPKQS